MPKSNAQTTKETAPSGAVTRRRLLSASAELIGDSATVVVVDPDGAALDVTHTYTFRNTTDDQAFSGFFETLPDAARDVSAAAAGRSLPVVNIPDGEGFAEWLVSFEAPLNPGQSIDVELTWRLTGLLGDPDEFSRATGEKFHLFDEARVVRAVGQNHDEPRNPEKILKIYVNCISSIKHRDRAILCRSRVARRQ